MESQVQDVEAHPGANNMDADQQRVFILVPKTGQPLSYLPTDLRGPVIFQESLSATRELLSATLDSCPAKILFRRSNILVALVRV